jgi:WD40 repeat protein
MDAGGRTVRTISAHKNGKGYSPVTTLAFSFDGKFLASGGHDGTAKIWEVSSGKLVSGFGGHNGNQFNSVSSVSWSPDGNALVTTDLKTLRAWDIKSGRVRASKNYLSQAGTSYISVATYTPDGASIVVDAIGLSIVDSQSLEMIGRFGEYSYAELVKGFDDGSDNVLLSRTSPLSFVKLNALTGAFTSLYRGEDNSGAWSSVASSRDGKRIVGLNNNDLNYIDLTKNEPPRVLQQNLKEAYVASISADGQKIAVGSQGEITLLDANTDKIIRKIRGSDPTRSPSVLAFGPATLISDSAYQTLSFLDLASGQARFTQKFDNLGSETAISPDGMSFLIPDTGRFQYSGPGTGHRDFTIDLWSFNGPKLSKKLVLPGVQIVNEHLVFDHSGTKMATGGFEAIARMWDLNSSSVTRTFRGHTGPINALQFAANGSRLISTAGDGLKVWDTNSSNLLASLLFLDAGEWIVITPEGFFDASSPKASGNLSIVRGLEASSIDQVYNALYRPDLVREKLAGDPDGKVKAAAAKLDLNKVMASGSAPKVAITSPAAGTSSATDEIAIEATVSDQGGGIGKVEWRVNGVTSGIETRGLERVEAGASTGRSLTVKRSLALERGENRIEVLAYNNKDLIASEPASVTVKWDGEKTATPPKLFVMAVGVNDYYDSRLRLSYAVPDATAIAEGFRKAGTGLYAAVDVTTVLDTDVTIANLDKVFTELGKKAQPRDVFVFFLAGHGKTKNGRYYFLPRDFRYEDEDSIEKAGMDQDKFQAWFARIPARKSILLYDTCESGSLTGTKARGNDIDERLGALNRMTRATGRTFLTATTDDAPALEGYRGHGVFTYALLDALEHADVNKNGLIEVSELADYIDQKVPDFSFEAFKLRQIPQRNIVGNNFALTNKMVVLNALADPAASNSGKGIGSPPAAASTSANTSIPTKPTHVVISTSPTDVFETIAADGTKGIAVQRLSFGTLVVVIESSDGWDLIAREGRPLGYVAHAGLAPVQ